MTLVSEHVINEIHHRCNIVEIISEYIPLKPAGRNFKALCPFHNEKTPSFVVNTDKQIFHCFGCGAGGDVISFVMKYEKLEFPEALETLAKKNGIATATTEKTDKSTSLRTKIHKINEIAAGFYVDILRNKNIAQPARRYLKERQLNDDTTSEFRIGYAPGGWDSFFTFAKSKGQTQELLERAGLIIQGKLDGFYDRFRDRIIFPIFDIQGKIIAFGGRVLDDRLPKYINSPDTIIYRKSRNLYGLNKTKDYINREDYVVIVEGYLDLLTSYQNGIRNIVASLGTALTHEQVRILKRYTHNVVMIYDADEAGEMATLRGLDILIEHGMNVKVALLAAGLDPDSFINQRGSAEFLECIKRAKSLLEYKLELLLSKYNINIPEDKTEIANQMLLTIKKIDNEVLKHEYVRKLSRAVSVNEEFLLRQLRKTNNNYNSIAYTTKDKTQDGEKLEEAEKILITLIFEDQSTRQEILRRINIDDFSNPRVKKIMQTISALAEENQKLTPAHVFSRLDDELTKSVFSELMAAECVILDIRKNIDDCIKHIKKKSINKCCMILQSEMRQAEISHNHELVRKLLNEYNILIKER
ncbi:MAG: DNA primase [Candidatus Omnitrophota bacterium]